MTARPRIRLALVVALSWTPPAFGQWSFNGYAVTFPSSVHQQPLLAALFGGTTNSTADVTRLRLRPSFDISNSTYLRLEYEAAATYLSSHGALLVPSFARGQVVDLSWEAHRRGRWTVAHGVDRLFLRTMIGAVDLTLGRQRIAWGSGRIWNPTDLFNPLNPANFSKIEKDGVDAAVATVRMGELSDLTAVWNPQRRRSSSFGARARTNWEGFDLAAVGGRFDDLWVVGGDITGSVWDAGIRLEGIHATPHRNGGGGTTRLIAGVDNQFTGRLYGLMEYQYNGAGASDPAGYDILRLFNGQILHVGRHYAVVRGSYLLHPLVSLQAGVMRNINDRSGYAGGSVTVSLTEEASVALGGQYTFGAVSSEYWYYPRSLYVRGDIFF